MSAMADRMNDFGEWSLTTRASLKRVVMIVVIALLGACAASGGVGEESWAAYGFMRPAPVGEGELIGVYPSKKECEAAADGWKSAQVAGVSISSACYPSDKR